MHSSYHSLKMGPSAHHFQGFPPSEYQNNHQIPLARPLSNHTLPPINSHQKIHNYPKSHKKGPKPKKKLFGDDFMQMMMMMNMFKNKSSRIDPVDIEIKKALERQHEMMNQIKRPQKNIQENRRVLDRIKKLERKIDEAMEDTEEKNPVMDMFFLQNIMMSQNSISS